MIWASRESGKDRNSRMTLRAKALVRSRSCSDVILILNAPCCLPCLKSQITNEKSQILRLSVDFSKNNINASNSRDHVCDQAAFTHLGEHLEVCVGGRAHVYSHRLRRAVA